MANDNAKKQLEDEIELLSKNEEMTSKANDELREVLGLDKLDRIELFDNAHLFGTYNVSGMVVFIDGRPSKNNYRKYCSVVVVYFHFDIDTPPLPDSTVDYVLVPEKRFNAFSPEAQILEAAASLRAQLQPIMNVFNPDVIHCNDRQTFLPFRFDKNVLYSSHLLYCDLISIQGLDDIYFQELKIEKSALQNSCLSVFYSDFALKRASKIVSGKFNPVVLPLGFNPNKFKNSLLKQDKSKIKVGYEFY